MALIAGNARNGSRVHWPMAWRNETHEWHLVVNHNWRPVMHRRLITSDVWNSYDLTPTRLGLVEVSDAHRSIAMAVDNTNRTWVAGNWRNDGVGSNKAPLLSSSLNSIYSWTDRTEEFGLRGSYHSFVRFSDGTLIWSHNDLHTDGRGMVWHFDRMAPGGGNWQNISGGGPIMLATESPTPADRAYVLMIHVDDQDTLHAFFVWRPVWTETSSMSELCYARSYDKGDTWQSFEGDPLPKPWVYRDTVDIAGMKDSGNNPIGMGTNGGVCVGPDGTLYITGSQGAWYLHERSPGDSHWTSTPISSFGFSSCPVPTWDFGELWLWGRYSSTKVLSGIPLAAAPGRAWATLGPVGFGTPDGVYEFESGAVYHPLGPFNGGTGRRGQRISRFAVPNNNSPRVASIGDGVVSSPTPPQ